ncbi:MAG TPA: nucleotidyltransferase domain-containing protein [Candidatus Lokiarchaeia archaeon]|nr:nucleotidyltransferase domain-containing protein [Candidatus Lokiarchaeia archaeon]
MANQAEFLELFGHMIDSIKERIPLHAFIVFGSRARGDANKYSDYDLLIIGNFKESFRKRWDWVMHITPDVSIDLFCLTPEEFANLFDEFNLTAIDAIGEGIVLFGEDFIAPFKARYDEYVRKGMKKTSCLLIHPVQT